MSVKPLRYCELSLSPCTLTYGVGPCTAAIGVTGDFKCYNTPKTCQDVQNFDNAGSEQVIRWAVATSDLPVSIEAIPSIQSINVRPQQIDPGESLGVRESVTVSFGNHRDNDYLFDPYSSSRSGNPYNRGTFWGKFFARWGSLEGYDFRLIDGEVGQTLTEMKTRHYVIDSVAGPDSGGRVSFTAKDPLKLIDGKKAVVPLPSEGVLDAAITDVQTVFNLSPVGIGNKYDFSGVASIGDEKVTFTRFQDQITLTGRGLSGSVQEAHEAGETFQEAAAFSGYNPGLLLYALGQESQSGIDNYIFLFDWIDEVNAYLGRTYSGEVMKPTPLIDIYNEVIREAGFMIWSDVSEPDKKKRIKLKVLRQETPVLNVNDSIILKDTVKTKKLSSKRISQINVFHGKKNPLEEQDQKKNYTTIYKAVTENPVVALENNPSSIREILSRWITVFNLPAAESIGSRLLARYENIPRQVSFRMPSTYPLNAGDTFTFQSRVFEDSQGDIEAPFNCLVTQIDTANGVTSCSAEEVIFDQVNPGTDREIDITANVFDVNLRDVHDSIYTAPQSGDVITLNIFPGVIIGSTNYTAALDIGSWPAGVTINIDGTGRIEGRGADGAFNTALDGGDALLTTYAIDIIGDVEIWSGGGGGGQELVSGTPVAGLPGGGQLPGIDLNSGFSATTEAGAKNTSGIGPGDGGDPGQDGGASKNSFNPGGLAGNAINGVSFVTITGSPDVRGYQVN